MSERALRGSRLGASSYESDRAQELAPRQQIGYDCPNGHHFTVMFADDVEPPAAWECRQCGREALRVDTEQPEKKAGKRARTHWDMLLERRSIADLEQLLAERLDLLRTGGSRPGTNRRKSA